MSRLIFLVFPIFENWIKKIIKFDFNKSFSNQIHWTHKNGLLTFFFFFFYSLFILLLFSVLCMFNFRVKSQTTRNMVSSEWIRWKSCLFGWIHITRFKFDFPHHSSWRDGGFTKSHHLFSCFRNSHRSCHFPCSTTGEIFFWSSWSWNFFQSVIKKKFCFFFFFVENAVWCCKQKRNTFFLSFLIFEKKKQKTHIFDGWKNNDGLTNVKIICLLLWSGFLIRSNHVFWTNPFFELFLSQQSQLEACFLQWQSLFVCCLCGLCSI